MLRQYTLSGARQICLLLFFISAIVSEAATALKTTINDKKTQEDDAPQASREKKTHVGTGLSITTKSTTQRAVTAPLRSDASSPVDSGSCRMQEYSLSFHAEYLSQNPNQQTSFDNLLRLEEKRQHQIRKSMKPPPRISPIFMGIMGSSLLFALSAFVWDPSSAQSLWQSVINKKVGTALAVAWLPWCWYHPAKLALVDLLILIQFVRQPAVLPYLQKEVVPILWKTFYTMIMTEAWTRTWKYVFAHVEQIRQFVIVKYQDGTENKDRSEESWKDGHLVWPTGEPPSWLVQLHVAVVGSVRKGIKSAFKKSVQETVFSAFVVWKEALQEQIMLSAEWN